LQLNNQQIVMKNQIIFFTGGTSGLGKVAACELANLGATVVVTVRNIEKGRILLNYFQEKYKSPKGGFDLLDCNLSSFLSIQQAVLAFQKKYDRLDMLINNAGLWKNQYQETKDAVEETFHVNFLAPLLLTELLAEMLTKSKNARIIFTSSGLHQGKIQLEDIEYRKNFKGFNAYRQSKLAIILLTRLLAEKLSDKYIGVYSQHPGVVKTDLAWESNRAMRTIFLSMGISPQKGSKTLLYLATEPKAYLKSGEYYYKNKVTQTTPESYDMEMAEKLVEHSNKYLGKWLTSKTDLINKF
jgi:NAD(P)-dependent dehydrogenase (short-subunit alcohol dehydrogenase family)